MHQSRRRARVALSGSRYGSKSSINVCVLAGIVLVLGSVAILQLRLTIVGVVPSQQADNAEQVGVRFRPDGNGKGDKSSGNGEEIGERLEELWTKMGKKEFDSFGHIERGANLEVESSVVSSLSGIFETEESRNGVKYAENDLEIEDDDEDADEFESFSGDSRRYFHDANDAEKASIEGSNRDQISLLEEKKSAINYQLNDEESTLGGASQSVEAALPSKTSRLTADLTSLSADTVANSAGTRENRNGYISPSRVAEKFGAHTVALLNVTESKTSRFRREKSSSDIKGRLHPQLKEVSVRQRVAVQDRVNIVEERNKWNLSSVKVGRQDQIRESKQWNSHGNSSERNIDLPESKKQGRRFHDLNPKGDSRKWSSFPGLHPQLSFSGFMDEFLFDQKCSLRIFMVWMTPPWSFTVRHQRVLESLLSIHPKACVVVFSETMELRFFKSFVDDGYRVAVVIPNLMELLEDTPTDVFSSIWMEWRKVDLFYIHYSELLRLAALYKYGGIYLDFDMIVLKPLTSLKNTIGTELLENGQQRLNGAVMVSERFSPFLNRCMVEFTATYDEKLRDWNGAALLDRVWKFWPDHNDVTVDAGDRPKLESPLLFFPLSSSNISRFFATPEDDLVLAEDQDLLDRILLQSIAVHIWNGLTSTLIPESGSLVEKLIDRNCLQCIDIL